MVEALTEKQYDVNYTWGIGTHSNKQGGAIMPEMLRWLWRDYPRPDDPKDPRDRTLLVPGVPQKREPQHQASATVDHRQALSDLSPETTIIMMS